MKKFLFLLLFIISVIHAEAQQTTGTEPSANKNHKSKRDISNEKIHYGTASFYANKFEGRETANGEIFSQEKLTAASNILPINHWVRVTNMKNNLTVVLQINDRMHKNNKRLIDLSKSAAKKLKYTGSGLAHVKVEVLGKMRPAGIAKE